MAGLLVLVFLIVPVVELWIVIAVWGQIGGLTTIALLVIISVLGASLMRREGLSVWIRISKQLASGQIPTNELIDGALILFGGALMLTPGFFTDALGLSLLFPPSRFVARSVLRRRFQTDIEGYQRRGGVRFVTFGPGVGFSSAGFSGAQDPNIIDGEVISDEIADRPGDRHHPGLGRGDDS